MPRILIKNAKALVGTHAPEVRRVAGAQMADLPLIENAWLQAENGRITGMGPMTDFPGVTDWNDLTVIEAEGRLVLPGWCDPHTHTVFAAPREQEFVDRINGLSYQEIAARGGGILNSARKLRDMSADDLYDQARQRLEEMMRQGTVAVEIKSGYGLTVESELKMLHVIARLRETLPLRIKATLLAAHAIPPEFMNDRKAWVDRIVEELIPVVARERLADHVDVFCETNYYTVEEMDRILQAGAEHGLPGKVHVNQFTSIGGIQAAVANKAWSVDHLEVMRPEDIDALIGSGTIPTVLPSCSFFLNIPYAPVRDLITAGLPVALATDHNPGSTPSGNMNFILSLACLELRMLPEESVNAMTINAASAMGMSDHFGALSVGRNASLIITRPVPSLAYLPYAFGTDHIDTVIIDGTIIRSGTAIP